MSSSKWKLRMKKNARNHVTFTSFNSIVIKSKCNQSSSSHCVHNYYKSINIKNHWCAFEFEKNTIIESICRVWCKNCQTISIQTPVSNAHTHRHRHTLTLTLSPRNIKRFDVKLHLHFLLECANYRCCCCCFV